MKRQASAEVRPITAQDLLGSSGIDAVLHQEGAARRFSTGARSLGDYVDDVASTARINSKALQEKLDGLGRHQADVGEKMREELGGVQPQDVANYCTDVWQRWAIFMDILRRRGNTFVQHTAEGCPPVLVYDFDVIIDGMTLERPVNYSLVAIHPPKGVKVRQDGRPYIIVDPRAGHGSGIGGFKNESEVGVALHAGHPVYFCIFTTQPTPNQTLADVTRAEADFVREVRRRHPRSPKPVIIGNCQGGWAAMLLAASNPDLTGPVVVNGAPLSYWAGTRGKNPMRYVGGMLGGVTPALLMADLGNGRFDGANLVLNFENLNPGNSLWEKYYDVFADVEGQAERYLDFERWWSGFYFMNESEIRWIVENLFVGNQLAHGGAQLDPRLHIDLRNIRAPIIVFASHGDNITPPPQALNWISDLYSSVQEIKARGQRIVYTIHDKVGHLGIFVSSAIAQEGAQGDRLDAEGHRGDGAGPLRDEDRGRRGRGAREALRDLVPRAHDRRHPGARRRARRRAAVRRRVPALPDRRGSLRADAAALRARPVQRGHGAHPRRHAAAAAAAHPAQRPQPVPRDGSRLRGHGPRQPDQGRQGQSALPAGEDERRALHAVVRPRPRPARRGHRDALLRDLLVAHHAGAARPSAPSKISEVAGTDLRSLNEVSQALDNIGRGGYPVAVIRMLILLAHARKSVRRDRLERSNELLTTKEPFASLGPATRARIIHEQGLIVEFEPVLALATLPGLVPGMAERRRAIHDCEFVLGAPGEMNEDTSEMLARIKTALDVEGARPKASRAGTKEAPARQGPGLTAGAALRAGPAARATAPAA